MLVLGWVASATGSVRYQACAFPRHPKRFTFRPAFFAFPCALLGLRAFFVFAAGSAPAAARAAPPPPSIPPPVAASVGVVAPSCSFSAHAARFVLLRGASVVVAHLRPSFACAATPPTSSCSDCRDASAASLLARSALLRSSLPFAAATAAACAVGSTSLFLARNRPSASVVLAMMGPPWCGVRGPTPRGPT